MPESAPKVGRHLSPSAATVPRLTLCERLTEELETAQPEREVRHRVTSMGILGVDWESEEDPDGDPGDRLRSQWADDVDQVPRPLPR